MDKVQRYDVEIEEKPDDTGRWVKYEDHKTIVDKLIHENKLMKEAIMQMEGIGGT